MENKGRRKKEKMGLPNSLSSSGKMGLEGEMVIAKRPTGNSAFTAKNQGRGKTSRVTKD